MSDKIIRNSARCLLCTMEIESKDRHDFRSCRCGALSVDGGKDYLRRLYKEDDQWEETSKIEEVPDPEDDYNAGLSILRGDHD